MLKNFLKIFILPVVTMSIFFLFVGCAKTQEQKELKATENNISIRIEGGVYPFEKQDVLSSVSGYVKDVYVKNGDRVKKGDKIYSLDEEMIKLDIKNQQIQLSSLEDVRKHLKSQKTYSGNIPSINLAAQELKKIAYLKSKGYISDFEMNKYKKTYINALYSNKNNNDNYEKIRNIDKLIALSKIELEKLKYKSDHANGYAMINGIVSNLSVSKGESIGIGKKVCSVVNISKVIVKAGFSTGLLPFVHKNQHISISFVTTPPYRVDAKIKKVNPVIDPAFGRMTIEAIVPNNNYILQEGTRALVTISLPKKGQEEVKKYFLNNKRDTILEIKSKI